MAVVGRWPPIRGGRSGVVVKRGSTVPPFYKVNGKLKRGPLQHYKNT